MSEKNKRKKSLSTSKSRLPNKGNNKRNTATPRKKSCSYGGSGNSGGGGGLYELLWLVIGSLATIAGKAIVRKFFAPETNEQTKDVVKRKFVQKHSEPTRDVSIIDIDEQYKCTDISELPYLLFGKLIHLLEVVVIYAAAKVGKTFLAIFIARNASPKKVAYFALDDNGDNQYIRTKDYANIEYIGNKKFLEYYEDLRNYSNDICGERAFWDHVLKDPAQIQERKNKLMRELGTYDPQKIDFIFLYELLVEFVYNDAEIFILDSLNALLRTEWNINRPVIERLQSYIKRAGKTLIILHHTNKKGEYAGNSALSQTVDLVINMEKLPFGPITEDNVHREFRKLTVENARYLQGTYECEVEMRSTGNNSVDFIPCDGLVKQMNFNMEPIQRKILEVIGSKTLITNKELFEQLPSYAERSILNALTKLGDMGYISMADGRTWNTIKNLQDVAI